MKRNVPNVLKNGLFKTVFLSITLLALFGSSAHAAICPEAKELKWDEGYFPARVFTDSGWEGGELYNKGNERRKEIEFESAGVFTEAKSQPGNVFCGYIAPNESGRRNDIPYIVVQISPPNNPLGRIIGKPSNWEHVIAPTGDGFYRCSMQNGLSREECRYRLEGGAHVNASANPYVPVRK